uniref:Uncharacterized protein n=1 Tax=Candidatus Kentrum sp. FM TaxID=2126340 RepID=A0A450RY91_9GAMM|nr:MAG: hypothetical protein BECKFM1743A_GA0114220_100146 [Candidatus Kentron sp. FM]VFJ44525.1 MAG: hypothetical protein BECKFM1743C_GA0114222_100128 [Candidatus Kentron sp. FM]VFK05986.1 MAG: hypothetical protein BECKFM1743B_GA0114221_1000812 [Candidatus Kentron sp. FM]
MTEKTRHETDKTTTEFDGTWEVIDKLEADTRDFFLGNPPPPSSPSPDAKPAAEENNESEPEQNRLLNLFWWLLLFLSWALSTVGFYVLFSGWSVETPFGTDAFIANIQPEKLSFWIQLILAMFFAFLGAFLVGRMSRSMVRRELGPGTRLISILLLGIGLLLSGMSGFVVIWSFNNHEALLAKHQARLDRRLDAAIEDVKEYYADRFKGENGKSKKLRQEQDRQGQIESFSNKADEFQKRIDEYDSENGEFKRSLRFLRAIGSDHSQTWIRGRIEEFYGNPDHRNPMLCHLLGECGAGEPGFGRETTVLIGKMAEESVVNLHGLCEEIASNIRDLRAGEPDSKPCARINEDLKDLKEEFNAKSLSMSKQPNHDWLTGAFLSGLENRFIGPRLLDVKGQLLKFKNLLKGETQSDPKYSSDEYGWINFDDKFRSRRKPIDDHKDEDPPRFTAAFKKLKTLSNDLARLLGEEEPRPVVSPKPQRLHTVVRERFFTTIFPFANAYYVPGRYLNKENLVTDQNQIKSAKLITAIEEVNETMPFSREELVTTLADRLGRRLSPYLRVQLLGAAHCGNDCQQRIDALRMDHETFAGKLEEPSMKDLATTSARDIENRLGALTDRERDLLWGAIEKRKATANNEWFAYILAALFDVLAVVLGVFDEMRKRGPAHWHKRLFGWLKRIPAWMPECFPLSWMPDSEAKDRLEKACTERRARRKRNGWEFELHIHWETFLRFSRESFIERCDDFERKKKKRWKQILETGEGGIEARVDASIGQDLVLMATGLPGAEIKSLGKVASELSKIYQGIAEDSGKMHEAFRDEMDTLHKSLIEIGVIRDQYRNHKEEMKLMVSNLSAERTRAELEATLTKISGLKQSSEEAQKEVRRYVDQSLKSFRSLLTNIEHFDQTDFYQRLSPREREKYRTFAATLKESTNTLSNRIDEYLSASASGSSGNRDEEKEHNEGPNANV